MTPPKNILVITYWSFADALVQTYTLPYLKIMLGSLPPGSNIYLVTLEKKSGPGATVEGYPAITNLPFHYMPFGFLASIAWFRNILTLRNVVKRYRIDFIHAFCTPAGMIGYLLSCISGKPLILDSYEPHAEAMVENGEWKKNSKGFKILFYFEKKQSRHAKHIIAAAPGMDTYAREKYGVVLKSMQVKPACVDLDKFRLQDRKDRALLEELQLQDKIVSIYAGKFGGIYLKEEVFEFYKACYQLWGNRFAALILTSHSAGEIESMAHKAGLPLQLFRIKFVPHAQIPRYMGLGDFAITPVKPVPTKRYCTPIKNGEYWAMGLPVVITRDISVDSSLIENNNAGYVLKDLSPKEYRLAAEKINALLAEKELALKIRGLAERYRHYDSARATYAVVYAS